MIGKTMISNLQDKYEQLSPSQKEIFAGYGLRQVKHFVEISLPMIEQELPADCVVQGINAEGKMQAIHLQTQQRSWHQTSCQITRYWPAILLEPHLAPTLASK